MPAIACPSCNEDDNLSGERQPDGSLEITCQTCGTTWQRGRRTCALCGSEDLAYSPQPLWERGRGDQRTPAGRIDAYNCYRCGGRDVTSNNPIPGSPDHVASRRFEGS